MIEAVAVIVPANDEELLLGACLDALEEACARVEHVVETFLIVVLDACTDASRAEAERVLRRPHRIVECAFTSVGRARALGARYALSYFGDRAPEQIWLATTDADSRVGPNWLVDQLALANSGVDALAGSIRIEDWRGYSDTQATAFEHFYDTHSHVHGTNLGVRADAYLDVGGFEPIAVGEDHALWTALQRRGKHIVSSRDIVVSTSSRSQGRAPGGFAALLSEHRRRVP